MEGARPAEAAPVATETTPARQAPRPPPPPPAGRCPLTSPNLGSDVRQGERERQMMRRSPQPRGRALGPPQAGPAPQNRPPPPAGGAGGEALATQQYIKTSQIGKRCAFLTCNVGASPCPAAAPLCWQCPAVLLPVCPFLSRFYWLGGGTIFSAVAGHDLRRKDDQSTQGVRPCQTNLPSNEPAWFPISILAGIT